MDLSVKGLSLRPSEAETLLEISELLTIENQPQSLRDIIYHSLQNNESQAIDHDVLVPETTRNELCSFVGMVANWGYIGMKRKVISDRKMIFRGLILAGEQVEWSAESYTTARSDAREYRRFVKDLSSLLGLSEVDIDLRQQLFD
jgi:hypothetical protein